MPVFDPAHALEADLQRLTPDLVPVIRSAGMPPLDGGSVDEALSLQIKRIVEQERLIDGGVLAGLHLLAGDLEASHQISQSLETPEGSFWHAIMHRREGDFSNAKYWFRRVGRHQVLDLLAGTDYGDPITFVDRCREALASHSSEAINTCEALQWSEWQLLLKDGLSRRS